jgi:hypothetical protein
LTRGTRFIGANNSCITVAEDICPKTTYVQRCLSQKSQHLDLEESSSGSALIWGGSPSQYLL